MLHNLCKLETYQSIRYEKFGIKGTTNLFINENLTLLIKRLFCKTKQKFKEAGYKYILDLEWEYFCEEGKWGQPYRCEL